MHNISLVILLIAVQSLLGFPDNSVGKESTYNAGDSWVRNMCWRRDKLPIPVFLGFPGGSAGKASACNSGGLGSIPGLGSSPGEGKGYPLQYSGLENSLDCIVHGVAESQTQLSNFTLCIDVISSFLMSGTSSLTFSLFLIWFSQTTEFWVGFPAFSIVLLFSVSSTSSWSALFPFSCLLWADLHFFSYFS